MSDKIVSLGEFADNAVMLTPEAVLKLALADIGVEGALEKGTKILIVALDETDLEGRGYDISWYQAGMKMSECLALTEVVKVRLLANMGY